MFKVKCPICDFINHLDSLEDLYFCDNCGFDFQANHCTNTECGIHLKPNASFCHICGYESSFFLDSYDVTISCDLDK